MFRTEGSRRGKRWWGKITLLLLTVLFASEAEGQSPQRLRGSSPRNPLPAVQAPAEQPGVVKRGGTSPSTRTPVSQPRLKGTVEEEVPPNIVVIMGDDIGYFNLGCYGGDLMGAATPNIDRLAREGLRLTSFYSHPSCTPGRAAFITGQLPIRTGLTTIGSPGSTVGLSSKDPTIAEVLKSMGYATGQFGKNHLGDRNEHLPTVHGFDEFWGCLYHLSAQEYEEDADLPRNPIIARRFGVRNVLDCVATEVDDASEELRFGQVGKQKIRDAGPLTKKRMETIDEEILAKSLDFMERQVKGKKPFFLYYNPTRMHVFLRVKKENQERSRASELDLYGAALAEHDDHVGILLDRIDRLKITSRTIVIYVSDNGAYEHMWPEGGTTPFRGQKGTTWEGGVRVPCLVRWPGKIDPNQVNSQLMAMEDLFPTIVAAAGNANIVARLKHGVEIGGKAYRVHLDGYNQLDFLTGDIDTQRDAVFYYDEARLTAVRYRQWKSHFAIKEKGGWDDPLQELSVPYVFNLLMDPFERQTGNEGRIVREHKAWMFEPLISVIKDHAKSFEEYPPRQRSESLDVDMMMNKVLKTAYQLKGSD